MRATCQIPNTIWAMRAVDYLAIHSIAGTVTTRRSVEKRSIDADSPSTARYRAAKSPTTLASEKLQHKRRAVANGLTPCKMRRSARNIADCIDTLASEPKITAFEIRMGWAARTKPTAKTATPEVADPIRSKQAATCIGKW